MVSTRPAVAATSANQIPGQVRSVDATVMAGSPNSRSASTAPAAPPSSAATVNAACWVLIRLVSAPAGDDRVERGGDRLQHHDQHGEGGAGGDGVLQQLQAGAIGESRSAAGPDPITAATSSVVPTASASTRAPGRAGAGLAVGASSVSAWRSRSSVGQGGDAAFRRGRRVAREAALQPAGDAAGGRGRGPGGGRGPGRLG